MTLTDKLTTLFRALVALPADEKVTADHLTALDTHVASLDAEIAAVKPTDPAQAATLQAIVDAANAAIPSDAAEPAPVVPAPAPVAA